MKLTKERLKIIIKEEIEAVIQEGGSVASDCDSLSQQKVYAEEQIGRATSRMEAEYHLAALQRIDAALAAMQCDDMQIGE